MHLNNLCFYLLYICNNMSIYMSNLNLNLFLVNSFDDYILRSPHFQTTTNFLYARAHTYMLLLWFKLTIMLVVHIALAFAVCHGGDNGSIFSSHKYKILVPLVLVPIYCILSAYLVVRFLLRIIPLVKELCLLILFLCLLFSICCQQFQFLLKPTFNIY